MVWFFRHIRDSIVRSPVYTQHCVALCLHRRRLSTKEKEIHLPSSKVQTEKRKNETKMTCFGAFVLEKYNAPRKISYIRNMLSLWMKSICMYTVTSSQGLVIHCGHALRTQRPLASGFVLASHGKSLSLHSTVRTFTPEPQVTEHWRTRKRNRRLMP